MICVQTFEIQCFYLSVVLQLFSAFGFFISLFVVVMARQRMRVRFCTRKVPGRWSLQSFFDDCSHFQKKGTCTGFTNDNKTKTKPITFGIKNGLCETRPCFSLSSPFPLPFLSLSSPFPVPFLFFLFPSFTLPFPFPFPRSCESFGQGVKPALGKTIRGKKNDNV